MSRWQQTRKPVLSSLTVVAVVASIATVHVAASTAINWVQKNPAQAPVGRAYAAIAYDSRRGRSVLFGGGNGPSATQTLNDTWEWDGASWVQGLPATTPPALIGAAMAYDSDRGVSVLFGGSSANGLSQNTWEWDGLNWTQRAPTNSPPGGTWLSMAYDAARKRMVLVGWDSSFSSPGQTWTYDGNTWTKMSPASTPSARFGTALAYDQVHKVVVLFGGRASGTRMNDTWQWDGSNWTQLSPATVPAARFWHSMAFDAQLGETVMFGGDHIAPFQLGPINDTWAWNGNNWTNLSPAAAPSPRAGQAMAYESATGAMLLFGGTDEGYPNEAFPNETWELSSPDADLALNGVPANITVAATSDSGATVNYGLPTAVDEDATSPSVSCDHPSGTTFPVGVTAVTCQAADTDDSPSTVSATFNITVTDTDLSLSPPPADITAVATSVSGGVVSYNTPVASDEDNQSPLVTCDHPSGSTFPTGTTTVTCQTYSADDTPSTVQESFRVTVVVDLQLTLDISPTTVAPGGAVTVTPTLTNLAEIDRTVSVSYSVTFTDASGITTTLATGSGSLTVGAGRTVSNSLPFSIKKHTAAGTYQVSVSAADLTGVVKALGRLTVT